MQIHPEKTPSCAAQKPAITYPCAWPYTLIGEDVAALTRAINAVCPAHSAISTSKTSSGGKYCSVKVEIMVTDEASRLAVYQNLKNHLAVKVVL